MSVGRCNYCAFVLDDLRSLQSSVLLWYALFLPAASLEMPAHSPFSKAGGHIYVAACQADAIALHCEVCLILQVIPKPPLGNFYLKEYLQDFEGFQSFEKQIPGSN